MSANIAPVFGALAPGVSNIANTHPSVASYAFNMLPGADGSYILAGFTFLSGSPESFYVPAFWGAGRIDGALPGSADSGAIEFNGLGTATEQDDGKFLVAGEMRVAAQYQLAVARYNADGSLDSTFASAPVVIPSALSESAQSMVVQPDGKIVVAGYAFSPEGETEAVIARLNSDGSIDTGFNSTGQVTFTPGAPVISLVVALERTDGKLIELVSASQSPSSGRSFFLLRYDVDGTPDTTFGSDGVVEQATALGSSTSAVLVASDGKTVVAGIEGNSFFLMRFTADGHLDTGFGVQGKATFVTAHPVTDLSPVLPKIIEQADGKLLIAANLEQRQAEFIRFNADGTPDTTFGAGGEAFAPGAHYFVDFTEQTDGTIVAAEALGISTLTPQIARFNHDGTPDTLSTPANPFSLSVVADVHDAAVRLAPAATIFDAEDDAGSYRGATLTIERHGGAVAGDLFGLDRSMMLNGFLSFDGYHLSTGSREVGTMVTTDGVLTIAFDSVQGNDTQPNINTVLKGLTWSPAGQAAGTTAAFDWAFDDGSGADNSQVTATSTVYVANVTRGIFDPAIGADIDDTLVATAAHQVLDGGGGDDMLRGSSFDDVLVGGNGNDTLVGGDGTDVALFDGAVADYSIARGPDGTFTVRGDFYTDTLTGIERLEFTDGRVALDVDGNAGKAYRLYQAAFDRIPDIGGLGYQMHDLDSGVTLEQVASNFISSPEFQATYGNVDNTRFVTLLYQNVLHREPDEGGLQFHLDELAHNETRADVLIHFSESPENQANVIGQIEDGMLYLP